MGGYNAKCDELKPAPYRIVRLYHGWLGYIAFFWQLVVAIIMGCLIIDAINTQPFLLPGFLIVSCVGYTLFMLIDIFFFGPYNFVRPIVGLASLNHNHLITYQIKLARDLQFHNDEKHFRVGLLLSAFLLLFLSIFLYNNGLNTFQPIPAIFTNADVMWFGINKVFQAGTLAICGILSLILFDSHSDLIFRTLTEMNRRVGNEFEGGELPLTGNGNKFNRPYFM